jgi:hypothetical protein
MGEGMFSQETQSSESQTIYLKIRDSIRAAFDPVAFKRMVNLAKAANERKIANPTAAVENVAKANEMTDEKKVKLLEYFLGDYQLTQFGLSQAIGRMAQDEDDGDDAHEIERVAGNVLKMSEKQLAAVLA